MGEQKILITKIAERFNINPEEAHKLLSEWVAGLKDNLDRDGSVKIEKFGTFLKDESRVTFEPSEELALEVNHKYAGMEPIEILPAYRKGAAGESRKADEQDQQEESEQKEENLIAPGGKEDEDSDTPDELSTSRETTQDQAEVDDQAALKDEEETADDEVSEESDESDDPFSEFDDKLDTEGEGAQEDEDDDLLSPYDEEFLPPEADEDDEPLEKDADIDSDNYKERATEGLEDSADVEKETEQDYFLETQEDYIPPGGQNEDGDSENKKESESEIEDADPFEVNQSEDTAPLDPDDEDDSLISPEEDKTHWDDLESESVEEKEDDKSEPQEADPIYSSETVDSDPEEDESVNEVTVTGQEDPSDSKKDEQEKFAAESQDKTRDNDKSKTNSNKGKIFAGVVLVIALVAGFLFVFLYDTNDTEPPLGEEVQEGAPVVADEEDEDETEPEETEEEPEQPETDEWGYRGDYVEIDDYYTIVVHSIRSRSSAEAEYEKIADQEFRATLNSYTPEDQEERWRVGIGQFANVDEAVEAAEELPEPWKDYHFIIRIR